MEHTFHSPDLIMFFTIKKNKRRKRGNDTVIRKHETVMHPYYEVMRQHETVMRKHETMICSYYEVMPEHETMKPEHETVMRSYYEVMRENETIKRGNETVTRSSHEVMHQLYQQARHFFQKNTHASNFFTGCYPANAGIFAVLRRAKKLFQKKFRLIRFKIVQFRSRRIFVK